MLKVIAACGNGMGSSLMMKMKIEQAFKELDIPVKVEHMSVGDAKNASNAFDIVFISSALEKNFDHIKNAKIIGLKNLLSKEEMIEKIKKQGIV
ncbi:PTS sugar transporter subunit IIB [Enterococcus faecalis]|nr:PTS sugar transporter subunit IIB [Enterococcus faecalis]